MRLTSLFALVLAATAFITQFAPAQGTSDLFPDPMTSAEAEAAIDRIGIEHDAKVQALKAFETYVERFIALRKGDIDAYLQSRGQVGATPTREEISSRVDKRRAIMRRIASIENEFFDQLSASAGDANAANVTRERARAERRRDWAASNPFMGRSGRLELADVVTSTIGDSTLPSESSIAVDGALKGYEDQATALARKLLDLAIEEPIALYDARAKAGVVQQPHGDGDAGPNAWREYFDAQEKIRAEAREKQLEIRGKLRANSRNTAKTIVGLLPDPIASEFRQSFMEKAYPSVARPRDPVPGIVTEAKAKVESGEVTNEEFASVQQLAANHTQRRAELDERLMAQADKEAMTGSGSPFFFQLVGEDSEEKKTDLQKLAEERQRLDDATIESIGGAARAMAKPKVEGRGDANQIIVNGLHFEMPDMVIEDGGGIMVMSGDDMGMGGGAIFSVAMSTGDASLTGAPSPITRPEVDALRDQFKLSPDEASVLDLLFEDYQSKWHELEEGELAELKSLPTTGPGGQDDQVPTDRNVARTFELRRVIVDRALALGREFVDGFGAAFSSKVSKEAAERTHHARDRASYLSATAGGSGFITRFNSGASGAAGLDLASVARDSKMSSTALAAAQGPLDAWDSTSVEAVRNRFEVHFAAQRLRADMDRKLAAQAVAEGRPGELRITTENEEIQKVNAAEAKAAEADRLVEAMNKQGLEAVLAALPDDASRDQLRDAWDREAWPSIYRDRRSVEPFITKALALPDISNEARLKVEAAASEYRVEFRRICHEMIDANEKSSKPTDKNDRGDGGPGGFDIHALQARQDAMNRLRFERNELNEKTLRRVKEALTPEQSEKIGDFPKPAKAMKMALPGGGGTQDVQIRRGGTVKKQAQ